MLFVNGLSVRGNNDFWPDLTQRNLMIIKRGWKRNWALCRSKTVIADSVAITRFRFLRQIPAFETNEFRTRNVDLVEKSTSVFEVCREFIVSNVPIYLLGAAPIQQRSRVNTDVSPERLKTWKQQKLECIRTNRNYVTVRRAVKLIRIVTSVLYQMCLLNILLPTNFVRGFFE